MNAVIFIAAATAEIVGCYAFWAWIRLGKSPLWLIPGVAALMIFAYLLTIPDSAAAGRTYAAYGGIYVVASLLWLWLAEQVHPDRWDVVGASVCLVGAAMIIYGPRPI